MRSLRVLTLNIWNDGGSWEERKEVIRAGLVELSPDVVGLQEVLRPTGGEALDQARQLALDLGYHVAYGAASEKEGVEFGNAVLSRFPIARSEVLALPQLDSDQARCLLFAALEAPFGTVPFFVTHLSWRLHEGYIREAQVKSIAKDVGNVAPSPSFPKRSPSR